MSIPAVSVTEGTDHLRNLVRDLRKVPEALRKELRPVMRQAGQSVLQEATLRSGWSDRIPGALRLRVSFAARRPGVFISVAKGNAPHARPYEGILGQREFRHPTFDDEPWISEHTRPFLVPALEANEGRAYSVIREAVDKALSRSNLL